MYSDNKILRFIIIFSPPHTAALCHTPQKVSHRERMCLEHARTVSPEFQKGQFRLSLYNAVQSEDIYYSSLHHRDATTESYSESVLLNLIGGN